MNELTIIEALKQYEFDEIPLLLKENAALQLCIVDELGNTALHHAVSSRDERFSPAIYVKERKKAIKLLIDAGANINARNHKGETPLWRAVKNRPELVETFLLAGADPNIVDNGGISPLMLAQEVKTAELLLSQGAQMNLKDAQGRTAIKHAKLHAVEDRKGKKVVKFLMLQRSNTQQTLPIFKFFDPKALEMILVYTDDPCDCCQQARGVLCEAELFIPERDEAFFVCPWCIANGELTRKYGIGPNDDADFYVSELNQYIFTTKLSTEEVVNKEALEEVQKRTPGFIPMQSKQWFIHCRTPCVFLGMPGWCDIKNIFHNIEILDPPEEEDFFEDLISCGEDDLTAYLFKCPQCQKLLMYWDMS